MRIQQFSALGLVTVAGSLLFACGGGGEVSVSNEPRSLQERLFSGSQADFAEQQRLIRACMTQQGFEYTPMDNRDGAGAVRQFDARSEDFVKEFGFGISTMFASAFDFTPAEDPNQEYRNSLDEAQRKAYDIALYGQELGGGSFSSAGGGGIAIPIGGGPGGDGAAQVMTPGGCLGDALKATGADQNPIDTGVFDDLRELEERIKSDPKMVEAMKKWSQCMDDAGYQYRDVDQARSELREEFGEITGLRISGDGGGFVVSVSASGPNGGGQTFDPLANVDKEKLAQLQEKEKRIALASFDCSERHVAETEQQVRKRYEDDFLKEHPELGAE